jgi:hypothetical protein
LEHWVRFATARGAQYLLIALCHIFVLVAHCEHRPPYLESFGTLQSCPLRKQHALTHVRLQRRLQRGN